MAKGAYIGVNNVARKVKKAYVGVVTDVPIYTDEIINITSANVGNYFTVENNLSDGGFQWSGNTYVSYPSAGDEDFCEAHWTPKADGWQISFDYDVSSQATWDEFEFDNPGHSTPNNGIRVSGIKTGSYPFTEVGACLCFIYSKDEDTSEGRDGVTLSNIKIKRTIQTGTETRSVARRIKKAYIGVGGVARLCWSSSSVDYNGTINTSISARWQYGATSTTSYALFAGGEYGRWYYYDDSDDEYDRWSLSSVYAYNSSLTEFQAANLVDGRHEMGAVSLGGCAFFGGGWQNGYGVVRCIEKYDDNLVNCGNIDDSAYRYRYGMTTLNDRILIVGGEGDDGYSDGTDTLITVDVNLTRQYIGDLGHSWTRGASATVGNYAIFGAGSFVTEMTSGYWNYIFAYDTNFSLHVLSGVNPDGRYWDANSAASVGDYAVFEEGGHGYRPVAIDKNLTVQSLPNTGFQQRSAAISSPESAVFFGGYGSNMGSTNVVYRYDTSLTRTKLTSLSVARAGLGAATVDNYILISNGFSNDSLSAPIEVSPVMDVYVISE